LFGQAVAEGCMGCVGLLRDFDFEPNGHHWLVDDTRSNNFAYHFLPAAQEKTSSLLQIRFKME